jgi:hypothetical protein
MPSRVICFLLLLSALPLCAYEPLVTGSLAAVGDFNNDGLPDLVGVLGNGSKAAISVLLNNGAGGFTRGKTALLPLGPNTFIYGLTVGDFDGDGLLDVAVVAPSGGQLLNLFVAYQRSSGFKVTTISLSGSTDGNIVAGDFNGDSRLDLALHAGATNVILFNQGGETFSAPQPIVSYDYEATNVADLNGDGNLDLILWGLGGGSVVLLGDGQGGFSLSQSGVIPSNTSDLSVADINGDGIPDLVTSTEDNSTGTRSSFSIAYGNGDGTFHAPVMGPNSVSFTSGFAVAAADVNHDGKIDVVALVGADDKGSVVVYENAGGGNFMSPVITPLPDAQQYLVVANFTGSVSLDAVTSPLFGGQVGFFLNNASGVFNLK